ncbi:hypothetical protein CR513_50094, partial [Mucuna pruriens]
MEECYKDMEVALVRANVLDSNEATMACFKRCLTLKKPYPNGPSSWSGKEKEKDKLRKEKNPNKGSFPPQGRKEEIMMPGLASTSKNNSVKCFKCLGKRHISSQYPNKRSMILREDETVDSESSWDESSSISKLDLSSDYSHNDKDLVMVRHLMSAQIGNDDDS